MSAHERRSMLKRMIVLAGDVAALEDTRAGRALIYGRSHVLTPVERSAFRRYHRRFRRAWRQVARDARSTANDRFQGMRLKGGDARSRP